MFIQLFVICANNEGFFGISRRGGVEGSDVEEEGNAEVKGKAEKNTRGTT
jgi:hypothetical protein